MTAYIFKIITLLGGLALFLFGMDVMGKALERQADGKAAARPGGGQYRQGKLHDPFLHLPNILQ